MNKDLIETPRFNFFIGDEVLLKGKIVGFDVDENKCVENVVRLEYGQTLNVPNNNIYITDDIVDKSKIKVVVPQFVADWYEENKDSFEFNVWDWIAFRDEAKKSENREFNNWINNSRENPIQTLVNMHQFGYEVEEEKRYIVSLIDEPQPVKVPQFVAEHIEHSKEIGRDLQDAMNSSLINKQVDQWLYTKNNMETFARAWLDGYEVEKEKRYTVVMKATKQPLYYNAMDKKLFFSMGGLATKFTRKQLEEAGVGWVFDCPGIEIEEVE